MRENLYGNHFRIVILEERKDLVRGDAKVSLGLGHVFEIGDLYDGVDAAETKVRHADVMLHDDDVPAQETWNLIGVTKDKVVDELVF